MVEKCLLSRREAMAGWRDFLNPYLKEIFAMLGVTDITFVNVERGVPVRRATTKSAPHEDGGQKLADSLAAVRHRVAQLAGFLQPVS